MELIELISVQPPSSPGSRISKDYCFKSRPALLLNDSIHTLFVFANYVEKLSLFLQEQLQTPEKWQHLLYFMYNKISNENNSSLPFSVMFP